MLKLYVKTGCPYCAKVLEKIEELGIEIKQLNVADPGISEELIARGGKKQEPYLIDEENNVEMYEAADIVEYLNKTYGDGTAGSTSSNESPGVCPI